MFTFLISIAAATMLNASAPAESNSFTTERVCAINESNSSDEKFLGEVNLCDPNGTVCLLGRAYKDSETGRIKVYVSGYNARYAQKSNNSNWSYMIRLDDKWYYFSF